MSKKDNEDIVQLTVEDKGKGIPEGFVKLNEIPIGEIKDGVVFNSKKVGKLDLVGKIYS